MCTMMQSSVPSSTVSVYAYMHLLSRDVFTSVCMDEFMGGPTRPTA